MNKNKRIDFMPLKMKGTVEVMTIQVENLTLQIGSFRLKDISLNVPTGKVAVILGPSGSGKSILLDALAGFSRPQSGRILLDSQDITALPPEARKIGFMFQDNALFPNLTVRENILFSLRFRNRRTPADDKESKIDVGQIMRMLHIDHLTDRAIGGLSGGEKQRVALGRALVRNPRIFLFDEPMSALDARAKEELQIELSELLHKLSLTAIYVTHDQAEASALGDLICIMENGQLAQTGTHDEIFRHPNSPFVAKFVGMENLFDGKVIELHPESDRRSLVSVQVIGTDGSSTAFTIITNQEVKLGEQVLIGIRPEDLIIQPRSPKQQFIDNGDKIFATIKDIVPWGIVYRLQMEGPFLITAYQNHQNIEKLNLTEQQYVQVTFPSTSLHLIKKGLKD
ncbi:ABC transporter ATP-binding protein [Desulfosporosinus sp. FKB]|uniref:ABC transporter ATP-binding protein n=1 Tax=Desulfosporosinus sp. FKB TaxID=1969835 RepID=UPI000B49DD5D|nr:ABC transporter ATP-binding protein [Desulfosporosinus sp. FKB]